MATTYAATVDARILPIREKHPTIFRTFEGLKSGETMLLVNDHDPKPLYYQFAAERTGQFEWRYLESGPDVWEVQIRRIAPAAAAQQPAERLGCCGHAVSGHGHADSHAHAGPPTQVLKEEHALILEALEALERKIAQVERGFPREAGPIAVMLHEHDVGRAFVRGIAEAATSPAADPAPVRRIIENGRGFIQLLRAHIEKENTILFPMADNVLGPEDQAYLEKEFERFEAEETGAGVHEASLKLLEELKAGAR